MSNKTIIIPGIMFLLFSSFVFADSITPGDVPIEYCAQLENVEEFPEYVFLTKIVGPMVGPEGEYGLLESKQCISMGYKFNSAEIYAMKKADYSENIDETKLIPLDADINRRTWTSMWDPRSKITESFTVRVEGDGVKLEKSVKYSFLTFATFIYLISIAALVVIILILRRRK